MKLHEIINMYKPNMGIVLAVSLVIFFLYMILQLIEMNTFVKGMDVLDVTKTTRGSLVYTYLVAYFVFFYKLTLNLLTLVVLLTIIMWIIVAMTHMLKSSQEGGYSSALELRGGSSSELGSKMKVVALKVVTYVMGTYFLKNFFMIFLVIIPLFILFFTYSFIWFYDRDIIQTKDQDNVARIMATNHNFMILVITTLSVFGILKLVIDYYMKLIMGTKSDGDGDGDGTEES